jgi:hypothetical protein
MPVKAELSGPDGGSIPFSGTDASELLALIGISETGGPDTAATAQDENPADDDSNA